MHKICVVGLGYVGLPLAIEFSKHYSVIGVDINSDRVNELNNSFDRTSEVNELDLKSALKSGDLLFFGKSSSKISHVGIAIKNNGEELKMIHASSSNGIIISTVTTNSYWSEKFQFAGRVTH